MMKLRALCGAAGAGKDTVADMMGWRKLAFADVLYQEVAQAFGVTVEWLKRREFKEVVDTVLSTKNCADHDFTQFSICKIERLEYLYYSRSPRQILQWWGDYRRAQNPDYFVWRVARELLEATGDVVITDVRFANEAAMVRSLGGEIWQVVRTGVDAGATGHKSDVDGSEFKPDRVIDNDGDLEQLARKVREMVQ